MITLFLAAALPIVCAKDCATEGRKKLDEPKVDYRINQASAQSTKGYRFRHSIV